MLKTLSTLLILLSSILSFSQAIKNKGVLPIKSYNVDDFYASPQSWGATQTESGILFVANSGGLLEFDNKTWKEHYFPGSFVLSNLYHDKKVFCGGINEFGYYFTNTNNNLEYISLRERFKDSISVSNCWKIYELNNEIFFWTVEGLFVFNINEDKLTLIRPENLFRRIFSTGKNIVVIEPNNPIKKYENGKLVKTGHSGTIKGSPINVMLSYNEDSILAISPKNDFFIISKDFKGERELNCNIKKHLEGDQIYTTAAANINDQYFALGSHRTGLFVIDKTGKIIQYFNQKKGLSNELSIGLYYDNEGSLWQFSATGISKIDIHSPLSTFDGNYGLDDKLIMSIGYQIGNKWIIGTTDGGYIKPWGDYEDPMSDSIKFKKIESLKNNELSSMEQLSKDHIALTFNSNFYTLSSGMKLKEFKALNSFNNSENLNKDSTEFLFLTDSGFHVLNFIEKELKYSHPVYCSFLSEFKNLVNKAYPKKHGYRWMMSNKKLFKIALNQSKDSIILIDTFTTKQLNLKGDFRYINGSWHDLFIISERDGVFFYDSIENKIVNRPEFNFEEKNLINFQKMNDSMIVCLYDDYSFEFMTYSKGSFTASKGGLSRIDNNKGLVSISAIGEESFIVSSTSKVLHYDRTLESQKKINFRTIIRDVKNIKNDSLIYAGQFNNVKLEQLSLPFTSNNISFSFAGPSFLSQKANQYKYKLDGFDDDWSLWSETSIKDYTNIPEGTYKFIVIAKNGLGIEGEPAVYEFTILAPWYRTIWAYGSYVILAIISVYGIVKWNTRRLEKDKEILEGIVEERTAEVVQQKNEIEQQAEEILAQNEQLEVVNAEINAQAEEIQAQNDQLEEINSELDEKNTKITDSINYAKKIQKAMLTSQEAISGMFDEHFILYMPRDIVSGDFYWAYKTPSGKILWTAADCTGHGVPGAMMSMIGNSLLNEIVIEKGIEEPGRILDNLRELLLKALERGGSDNAKEGMDIAFCSYDPNTMELQFAGAFNPLFIFRGEELMETPGSNMPIGAYKIMNPFENHTVQVQRGDVIYLFSDGYVDQMGGPKGKKFLPKRFRKKLTDIQELSLEEQEESLKATYLKWKGDHMQMDDVVIFGVKI